MLKSKKYLIMAGTIVAVLILILLINQNNNNTDAIEADKLNTKEEGNAFVNENIEVDEMATEAVAENDNKVTINEISNDKEATEKDQVVEIDEERKTQINNLITTYYDTSIEMNEDILMSKEAEESKAIESITKKREIIETYQTITTDIKPGLEIDTYVVFTTYDMKLPNIDTLVPGMSLLNITTNEDGQLRINNDPLNEALSDYVEQLTKEKEIQKMIEEVNSKLSNAVAKDNSLEEFIEYLKTDS